MVARSVSFRLKPNCVARFTQIVERDILPLLREQKGFQDEITLVLPEGLQVVGISLVGQRTKTPTPIAAECIRGC